ncbi:hypothetical protein BDZ45DRAFT_800156 [Acephala macrosclerotiorum]|nr:hypothetical protein BDZ45DRAFT_800156 [Acephala macrosclerotiorum]
MIRDGAKGQGVSFRQLIRLIEGIGNARQINNFTIKLLQQNLFLLSRCSRHAPSQASFRVLTASASVETGLTYGGATRIRPQPGDVVGSIAVGATRLASIAIVIPIPISSVTTALFIIRPSSLDKTLISTYCNVSARTLYL